MCALLYRGIYEHAHYGVRGEGSVDPELEFPRKSRGQRIPTAVIDALRIGLSADPEARFANADELLAALSGIDWERHQHVVTNTLGGIAGTACLIAAVGATA